MIRIVALTETGLRLAEYLVDHIDGSTLWYRPKPFTDRLREAFTEGDRLLLIMATGIAVRTLAPVIDNKLVDPAVLVLDESGHFVIPLLSGHEGGANQWACEVATLLKAQLVVTTAKPYLAPVYSVGMGCERGCTQDHLRAHLDRCLDLAGIGLSQVTEITSIDIKADEVGLIALAKSLDIPFRTWNKRLLTTVDHLLNSRSEYVFKTVGVYGVAESAALYGAGLLTGDSAELILTKQKTSKATCAIARSFPLQQSGQEPEWLKSASKNNESGN
ncbi:cobalt-precorrin 5A hydrolase [Sinobacterium caligoides]|uniref:Cobalt-precorrin 5A hydrolase n=1 Tax=Sinobacterium caligoides TaxID=933926 RepID=A0A3N2DYI6_9GAMM|nr:cobalamin biosynthesis protein [Sinobacterium caligoides]ROS04888.1 cobalt-precorrin 5A hydrolase [Sinobacterium caligoides]